MSKSAENQKFKSVIVIIIIKESLLKIVNSNTTK